MLAAVVRLRFAFFLFRLNKVLQRDRGKDLFHFLFQFFPDIPRAAGPDLRARFRIINTVDRCQRPFKNQDNVLQRYLRRGPAQAVAGLPAARAPDQPCFTQGGEQVIQILCRYGLPRGNVFQLGVIAVSVQGNINHCPRSVTASG